MSALTARQRILFFLQERPAASAADLSRALNMSAATVRHHLSILLADGRIVMVGERHTERRGRPVKAYRLSEKSIGDNLAFLSDSLLHEWLDKLPDSKREKALQAVAHGLTSRIGLADPNIPASRRLAWLVEKLNVLRYQARWEAGAKGPRILFAHCPYAAIIDAHPELCQIDAALLGEEMNAQAEQVAKIERQFGGQTHCIFMIGS